MSDLKKLVLEIMQKGSDNIEIHEDNAHIIKKLYQDSEQVKEVTNIEPKQVEIKQAENENIQDTAEIIEESLSLAEKEKELILKALQKHRGKRKYAAEDLGISERTLYRKIKEYDIN